MSKHEPKQGSAAYVGSGNQPRIGDRLRERLESGSVTVYAVSKATGLASNSLYKFLDGSDLSLASVELLADFFEMELSPTKKRRK